MAIIFSFNPSPLNFLLKEEKRILKRINTKQKTELKDALRKRSLRPFEKLLQTQQEELALSQIKGDQILLELRQCLKCFTTRSKHQILFHESFVQANLKNIYGDDFAANEIRIKLENLIDQVQEFALVCCPRRFGKTFAVAMFVAAYLVCCEATVVVFSPGKRQSTMLLQLIKEKTYELRESGWEFEVVQENAENFCISRRGFIKKVQALPAKEEVSVFILFYYLQININRKKRILFFKNPS